MQVFLLRHAEREHIKDKSFMNTAKLTENGKQQAKKFGRFFNASIKSGQKVSVLTSKIDRCYQTGLFFANGLDAEKVSSIEKDDTGTLSMVIRENTETLAHFPLYENKYKEFLDDWEAGKLDEFCHPMQEISQKVGELISKKNGSADFLFVFTHDNVISAFGRKHEISQFNGSAQPGYLNGLQHRNFSNSSLQWELFALNF